MQELRLYSFVNFYLSSIQQGVQTGHAAVDLVRKYNAPKGTPSQLGKQCDMVGDWADNHKTFIILNGGNFSSLNLTKDIIKQSGFPWVSFSEDVDSLDGMLTTVAVVLPDYIFNVQPVREQGSLIGYALPQEDETNSTRILYTPTHELYQLIQLVKSARLAS